MHQQATVRDKDSSLPLQIHKLPSYSSNGGQSLSLPKHLLKETLLEGSLRLKRQRKKHQGPDLEDRSCFRTRGRQKKSSAPDSYQRMFRWFTSGNAYLSKGNKLNMRTQTQSMEKLGVETKIILFTALPGWIQS